MTRCGLVAVVGPPNAGKSTLLNRLVGQHLSITSPKPQSTRDRVVGIRSDDAVQMVFLDTPGLLDPRYPLHHAMLLAARRALDDADVILLVLDATELGAGPAPTLASLAQLPAPPRAPVIIALNKIDRVPPRIVASGLDDAVRLSALRGEGVDALLARLAAALPEGPFLYPPEDLSTQSMRFFAAELVREAALEQLEDELPYSIACAIEEFRDAESPVYIRGVVYVERDSQKGIVVGRGGERIRAIGTAARGKIERLVGGRVYLDLRVKVLPNWRRDAAALRRLGYRLTEESSS